MATTPAGPPAKDVTAMDWSDVTRFAGDVKDLLDGLMAIAGQLTNQSAFTIMPGGFQDAKALATAVSGVGSSAQADVAWLQRLLTDVQAGLTNAVKSLGNTDSLQKAGAQNLMKLLQNVNTDLGSPPGSTSSPSTTGA